MTFFQNLFLYFYNKLANQDIKIFYISVTFLKRIFHTFVACPCPGKYYNFRFVQLQLSSQNTRRK